MSLLIVKVIFNKAAILVACRGTKPLAFHILNAGRPASCCNHSFAIAKSFLAGLAASLYVPSHHCEVKAFRSWYGKPGCRLDYPPR